MQCKNDSEYGDMAISKGEGKHVFADVDDIIVNSVGASLAPDYTNIVELFVAPAKG
jgi:hypothetical protein